MGIEKAKMGDCYVGDWVSWDKYSVEGPELASTYNKPIIYPPVALKEWEFKKVWMCVKRTDH